MEWADKPTDAGFYWLKRDGWSREIVVEYRVPTDMPPVVILPGSEPFKPSRWPDARWCGPLVPPADDDTVEIVTLTEAQQ